MKNSLFVGLLSLLLGIGTTYAVMSQRQSDSSSTNTSTESMSHEGMSSMEGIEMKTMSQELMGKSGDEFDRAFISMMIEHHQDAVDMAKQAQTSAKHDEIKTLANEIITAQNREIDQMRNWQKQWNY